MTVHDEVVWLEAERSQPRNQHSLEGLRSIGWRNEANRRPPRLASLRAVAERTQCSGELNRLLIPSSCSQTILVGRRSRFKPVRPEGWVRFGPWRNEPNLGEMASFCRLTVWERRAVEPSRSSRRHGRSPCPRRSTRLGSDLIPLSRASDSRSVPRG